MANMKDSQNHNDKPLNIVSFASDKTSAQVMSATLSGLNIQACEAYDGDFKSAIQYLKHHRSPQIVVADISTSELPLSDVRNLLEVCDPNSYVVILGQRNDIGLYRDLVRFGVTDYVVKPISVDFMSRCLLDIVQGDNESYLEARIGKLILFLGTRGGVGSSTLATNMGWILSQEKFKRTLLVDLDLHHGSSGLFLDMKTKNHLHDLLENIDSLDESILDVSFQKHSERFYVLSQNHDFEKDFHCPRESLEKLLPILRDRFHYVLVDMPRIMSDVTRMLLQYASNIFLVADPSLISVRDVMRIFEFVGVDRAKTKVSVILNKTGLFHRGEISTAAFEQSINHPVNFTLPYDPLHPLIAANMGKPLASFDASKLKSHLRSMASHISGRIQMEDPTLQQNIVEKFQDWLARVSFFNTWLPGSGESNFARSSVSIMKPEDTLNRDQAAPSL